MNWGVTADSLEGLGVMNVVRQRLILLLLVEQCLDYPWLRSTLPFMPTARSCGSVLSGL